LKIGAGRLHLRILVVLILHHVVILCPRAAFRKIADGPLPYKAAMRVGIMKSQCEARRAAETCGAALDLAC
jgi:hypothetical protein